MTFSVITIPASTSTPMEMAILISHRFSTVRMADRIVVMHEAAIVGEYINKNVDLNRLVADVSGPASGRGQHEAATQAMAG